MTAPNPVIRQPDVEAHVWASVRHLPGVTSFLYQQTRLWPGWVVAAQLQVDARAPRKQRARDLAEDARVIIEALPAAPWDGGVVSHVIVREGPQWEPDDDGGPRYYARYELRVHPSRDAIPAPLVGGDSGRAAAPDPLPADGRASRKERP